MDKVNLEDYLDTKRQSILLGPWEKWFSDSHTYKLELKRYSEFKVYSNNGKITKEVLLGDKSIELSNSEVNSLVIFAHLKRSTKKNQDIPIMKTCLEFYEKITEERKSVILDILPPNLHFDGISIPGIVLLKESFILENDPILFAHEIAHQWWGNQQLKKSVGSTIWTESIAEVFSLIFAFENNYIEKFEKAMYEVYKLHTYRLNKKISVVSSINSNIHSLSHYSLIYGSVVLLYLVKYLSAKESFIYKMNIMARTNINSVEEWFYILEDKKTNINAFFDDPSNYIQEQYGERKILKDLLTERIKKL